MNILVTGGLGYIGSHTCVELLEHGYNVIVIDNLSNSKIEVKDYIKTITGKDISFVEGDVCNKQTVEHVFATYTVDAVIHFAAYKAVGESVHKPIAYYQNNLMSTLTLCEVMSKHNCKKFVFSSSATVYGDPKQVPIDETCEVGATTNPYGTSKVMNEQILQDVYISDPTWDVVLLRYFNPIGAHHSGLIGESPVGIPNNIMPYIAMVANKELPELHVFGNDYDTPDGTGVRDYIHVVDLAKGHVKALDYMTKQHVGVDAINLGTGNGYSVLELVQAFEKDNHITVPYVIDPRREGDIAVCYAATDKAKDVLNWVAKKDIHDMVKDSWKFKMGLQGVVHEEN